MKYLDDPYILVGSCGVRFKLERNADYGTYHNHHRRGYNGYNDYNDYNDYNGGGFWSWFDNIANFIFTVSSMNSFYYRSSLFCLLFGSSGSTLSWKSSSSHWTYSALSSVAVFAAVDLLIVHIILITIPSSRLPTSTYPPIDLAHLVELIRKWMDVVRDGKTARASGPRLLPIAWLHALRSQLLPW